MPLIVEDGTMPAGANSFASLADADAYLVPRSLWTETTQDDAAMVTRKESALMRATDYLNTLSWVGYVEDWQRTMSWPREDVPIPRGKGFVPGISSPRQSALPAWKWRRSSSAGPTLSPPSNEAAGHVRKPQQDCGRR